MILCGGAIAKFSFMDSSIVEHVAYAEFGMNLVVLGTTVPELRRVTREYAKARMVAYAYKRCDAYCTSTLVARRSKGRILRLSKSSGS